MAPAKTQISFRRRVNFLMVAVSGRRIHGYLFLNRPVSLPCFKKVVAASANRHVHVFQIADETSLRGEFTNLVGEAFRNAGEEDDHPKSKSAASCIGEEINAIYRQARLHSAARF